MHQCFAADETWAVIGLEWGEIPMFLTFCLTENE